VPGSIPLLAVGELRGLAFEVVLAAGGASQFIAVRRGRSQVGQLADRAGERLQHHGVTLAE
jgi:hypothetical protein